ncbi:hypothetical protein ABZW18_15350 [Streptomyces sp. NPDC004647]|uniref:hypothetical protein n=1 Tax=Streptomyces sp. NPDC004647 TaxID=3154671 RepID=UPI0033A9D34E
MTNQICVRCQTSTDKPVLVRDEHGATGPGRRHYACSVCAPHFPRQLSPMAAFEMARAPGNEYAPP